MKVRATLSATYRYKSSATHAESVDPTVYPLLVVSEQSHQSAPGSASALLKLHLLQLRMARQACTVHT